MPYVGLIYVGSLQGTVMTGSSEFTSLVGRYYSIYRYLTC